MPKDILDIIPGLFTPKYGIQKPGDVIINLEVEKDHFKFLFNVGPVRHCLWVHKKELMKANYDYMIVAGLNHFDR